MTSPDKVAAYSDEEIERIRALRGGVYEVDCFERSRIIATLDALRAERDAMKIVAANANEALGALLDVSQKVAAERDAANRLLRDVRESVRHREGSTCDVPWPLVAKIDAHLTPSGKGAM